MRRTVEREPHRPGKEHDTDGEADSQSFGGVGGQPPQLVLAEYGAGDHQHDEGDDDEDRAQSEDLGREEELAEDEHA